MPRVALAFSGGLDTSCCVLELAREGHEVITVTADTGGFSRDEIEAIETRARAVGAVKHLAIDARQEVYDRFFSYILRGNSLRGGVYPVAVGAERFLQAEILARVALEEECQILAHGCTGAGNDQVRFDVALTALAPEMEILAPVRDGAITRERSTELLRSAGIEIPRSETTYSVNVGLVGATVGGGKTHDPWEEIPEEAYEAAGSVIDPEAPQEEVILSFHRGLPVALDGAVRGPLDLIARLDEKARPLGIGRGVHLGDTILGIKGRIGFVAPAATILIGAHRELEKLVLTSRQLEFKNGAGAYYGDLLHQGLHLDPVCRDLERLLESSQEKVEGDVRVRLGRFGFDVTGVRSSQALLHGGARYGEESSLWDGRDARGFSRIYGLAARIAEGRP